MASILITTFVSLWRSCTIPNWVHSGHFALLMGLLGQVPLRQNMMHGMYDIRRPILCSFRSWRCKDCFNESLNEAGYLARLIKTSCRLQLLVSQTVYSFLVSFCYDLLVQCCIKFDLRAVYGCDLESSVHIAVIFLNFKTSWLTCLFFPNFMFTETKSCMFWFWNTGLRT